ncbi:MAG: beta-propeller domain-containing protein [Mogibacterium sp.]|nr:beta-propeller domain-containing protein [Mogibacterium sp.]
MSKDFDHIKELFDSDGIRAPESLSEENMLAMLESSEKKQSPDQPVSQAKPEKKYTEKRPSKRFHPGRWAAVAAAALITVFSMSGLFDVLGDGPDTSVKDGRLYTFRSEREISRVLQNMEQGISFDDYRYKYVEVLEDDVAENESAAPEEAVDSTGTTGAAPDHSETYLQVEDVDEADIIKTDGRYIYYVNTDREVVILEAKDGEAEKLSTIGSSGIENYIYEIYIKGDRLITVGRFYRDDDDEGSSGIIVYDISDRSDPKVMWDFSQSGDILSSRMVGDNVYLVTSDRVYKGGRKLPMCGPSDSYDSMEAGDICCMPDPKSATYIVLSAVDVSSGEQGKSSTKAVLGASDEIYCNDHNLYVTSGEWDSETGALSTRIVRASLDGLDVDFNATSQVRGYTVNRFAMDERDGYFRIATTSQRDGMDVNNLFILDSDLNEAGKVTGFARNESIKAVRYIGDKAYVITYEAIDPLFIIDLSDPADPKIEGEVMIDGFSTLLIPVSGDRLLGIGHATGDNGYGGEYDSGLKLVLFDISDPADPKVLSSREFKDMSSFAQSDHHALTINTEAGWFAIPYEIYRSEFTDPDDVIVEDAEEPEDSSGEEVVEWVEEPAVSDTHEAGVLVFTPDNGFETVDQHAMDVSQIFRSVYIGEWIYALDGRGDVYSFKPSI